LAEIPHFLDSAKTMRVMHISNIRPHYGSHRKLLLDSEWSPQCPT